jgi:hypothetical protein
MAERWMDRQAKADFSEALARFQAVVPDIGKDGHVDYTPRGGGANVQYDFAKLPTIMRALRQPLADNGFSITFGDALIEEKGLSVETILMHLGGHAVSAKVSVPLETASKMGRQQEVGNAISYCRRYGVLQVTGVVTADGDSDCVPTGDAAYQAITDDQRIVLETLVAETGSDIVKFCEFMGVNSAQDISARDFARAKSALESKARAGRPTPPPEMSG